MKNLKIKQIILSAMLFLAFTPWSFCQEEEEEYLPRKTTSVEMKTNVIEDFPIPAKHSSPLMYCYQYRQNYSKKGAVCTLKSTPNVIEGTNFQKETKLFKASYQFPKGLAVNFDPEGRYFYRSNIDPQGKVNSFEISNSEGIPLLGYFWESKEVPVQLDFSKLSLRQEKLKNVTKPQETALYLNDIKVGFQKGEWQEVEWNGMSYMLYIQYSIASKRQDDGNCASGGYNLRGVLVNKKIIKDRS